MKKNKTAFIVIIALLGIVFLATIIFQLTGKKKATLPPGVHGIVATEVLQTNDYTYVNATEGDKKFWMAIVSTDLKPGDSLYYSRAMEMKNFKSRELDRTFESIFFVDDPSRTLSKPQAQPTQARTPGKVEVKKWSEVNVTVPKGGITLEQLYKNPGDYADRMVVVRGVVTRFNSQIMKKNWIHIQDGTEFSDKYDLTITTLDSVAVGAQATFTGRIGLGKDFGAGYYYDVIMEDAKASDIK